MVQLVLGAMIIALCLSEKVPPYITNSSYSGGPAWFLLVPAVIALLSLPISGLLLRSQSSRVRGIALSVAGSAAIVLFGAIVFALWVIRW
jgi:ABC-type polysaccharide/polyol phosphate export permease